MKTSDIFLCRCKIGRKTKDESGNIVIRELPKTELCLNANGIYYNLLNLKKYLVAPECKQLEENFVVMAIRLNEAELNENSRANLEERKKDLLYKIESEKAQINSIDDFTSFLPHIELLKCKKGKIVTEGDRKCILRLPEETCVALLYKGSHYDLNTGEEIKRLSHDNIKEDEIIAYAFETLDPEDLSDEEYKNCMFCASMLIPKLQGDNPNAPKVFYLR